MIVLSPNTVAAIALHAAESSWIIFVQAILPSQAGTGPIKIEGIRGSQLGSRLNTLARDNAFDIQLIGLLPSTDPQPHAAQIREDFSPALIHDDWFSPENYILVWVQSSAQQAMQELLALTHPGAIEGDGDQPVDIDRMAEILGVAVVTVRRMVKANQIPFLKWGRVYRFVPSDVLASLQQSDH